MTAKLSSTDSESADSANATVVPGAAILGYGFNVALARTPHDTTVRIVNIDDGTGTVVTEGGRDYRLPPNVDLIDIHDSSIKTHIFESTREYTNFIAGSVGVTASAWGFSGEFDASYSSLKNQSSAKYYGLIEANTDMWHLSVKNLERLPLDSTIASDLRSLGDTFDETNADRFYNFFRKWGTHVVSASAVGGFLRYCVTVSTASTLNHDTATANLKLEYDGVFAKGGATAKTEWDQLDKTWISSRDAELNVRGGDPGVLAGVVPPAKQEQYVNYNDIVQRWTSSVGTTPGVISHSLQPISRIAPDSQLHALDTATDSYLNQGVFVTAEQTVDLKKNPYVKVSNTASVTIGHKLVNPPHESPDAFSSQYWIVMADEHGSVHYNNNVLGDDPAHLDRLVDEVKNEPQGWWITVIAIGVSHPPSQRAFTWLSACGIPLTGWYDGYAGFPCQVVAIGQNNNHSFTGRMRSTDTPYRYFNAPDQRIEVGMPLFVPASTSH